LKDSDYCNLAISESVEAQKLLGILIVNSFKALNLYGKKSDSMKATAQTFQRILSNHCIADIAQAFDIWMKRQTQFPTPADIYGLIERNGKPPLSKVMYVNISKKDAYHRTSDDWEYIKEYELYQRTGDSNNTLTKVGNENTYLKKANNNLKDQISKLKAQSDIYCQKIAALEKKKYEIKTEPVNKIDATVKFMRESGASEEDIQIFIDGETNKLLNQA